MNFYKRHLGDYAKDTRTLSVFEHGVYTLLLDFYYSEEQQISDDDAHAICRTTNSKERSSVDKVLGRYFKQTPDGWRHNYADRVIEEARAKSAKASESASARWGNADKSQSDGNANASANASKTHEKPDALAMLATSHYPLKEETPPNPRKRGNRADRVEPELFIRFYAAYPRKVGRPQALARWLAINPDTATIEAIREGLIRWKASREWAKDDGEFIPHPATWLSQRRWQDAPLALVRSATVYGDMPQQVAV